MTVRVSENRRLADRWPSPGKTAEDAALFEDEVSIRISDRGYGYTVDTTESYSFSGQVGDLPNAKHGYDFGLMAHRGQLGLGTGYPIFLVDYWVEHVE